MARSWLIACPNGPCLEKLAEFVRTDLQTDCWFPAFAFVDLAIVHCVLIFRDREPRIPPNVPFSLVQSVPRDKSGAITCLRPLDPDLVYGKAAVDRWAEAVDAAFLRSTAFPRST